MALVDTYYRVRVVSSGLAGGPYLSTFNLGPAGTASGDEVAALVRGFLDDLSDDVVSGLAMAIDPSVQVINADNGQIISEEEADQDPVQGKKTQGPEWTAKQGLIYFKSDQFVSGKRLIGRLFVPGVPTDAGEQTPEPGYSSRLSNAYGAYRIACAAAGLAPVCVRRPKPQGASNGLAAEVTTSGLRPYWAVLRSRRD